MNYVLVNPPPLPVDTLTRVGDVVAAILHVAQDLAAALVTDNPDLPLEVHDGPSLGVIYDRALIIGLPDGADNPGYRATTERAQGMGRRKTETVTVHCLLTLSTGDDDAMADLRSQALTVMRYLDASLRSEDPIDEPWQRVAVLGDADWVGLLHQEGSTLNVLFDVEAVCLL